MSSISSNGARRHTPALQHATLISPNFSTPFAAAASICSRSATFATTVMISALYSFLSFSAVFSTSGDKSTMISFAPYLAYAVEIPSPSPAAAPVINATLPSNLAILHSPFHMKIVIVLTNIIIIYSRRFPVQVQIKFFLFFQIFRTSLGLLLFLSPPDVFSSLQEPSTAREGLLLPDRSQRISRIRHSVQGCRKMRSQLQ